MQQYISLPLACSPLAVGASGHHSKLAHQHFKLQGPQHAKVAQQQTWVAVMEASLAQGAG